jgi:hypothetical protein
MGFTRDRPKANAGDDEFQDALESKMFSISERRKKPRVECNYPTIILGIDQQGNTYRENAKLANLSRGGLYMWVNRHIEYNSIVSVTVLLTCSLIDEESPKLTTKGTVVRTEPHTNGTCGVAVKFKHHRFI